MGSWACLLRDYLDCTDRGEKSSPLWVSWLRFWTAQREKGHRAAGILQRTVSWLWKPHEVSICLTLLQPWHPHHDGPNSHTGSQSSLSFLSCLCQRVLSQLWEKRLKTLFRASHSDVDTSVSSRWVRSIAKTQSKECQHPFQMVQTTKPIFITWGSFFSEHTTCRWWLKCIREQTLHGLKPFAYSTWKLQSAVV